MPEAAIGEIMDLLNLTSCYSTFGNHRTGSGSQLKTEDWLLATLTKLTDKVEIFDYSYQHFDAKTEMLLSGRLVPSMALYYEAVGELQACRNIDLAAVDIDEDEGRAIALIHEKKKQAAQKKRDALVVATRCASDSLYALNVNTVLNGPIPVVLIPGGENKNLSEQGISLSYSASIDQRTAKNIIARFSPGSKQVAIVITTPISGWFTCAGERGTGIALAIALAGWLSKNYPVDLVLTSGHELGYLGGFEYTATLTQPPAAVIHIGSSLATFDSSLEVWTNSNSVVFESLGKILKQQKIALNQVKLCSQRSDWVGEAECWSQFNCPMLSIAGIHPLFHTPEDRIELASNQNNLEETFKLLCELVMVVETGI